MTTTSFAYSTSAAVSATLGAWHAAAAFRVSGSAQLGVASPSCVDLDTTFHLRIVGTAALKNCARLGWCCGVPVNGAARHCSRACCVVYTSEHCVSIVARAAPSHVACVWRSCCDRAAREPSA